MVGVAGKYKGCNTCRVRRVKCDELRPSCQKCIDTGRECGGYNRERVFIVGTAKDRGRCSSHPHRSLLNPKSKEKPPPLPPPKPTGPEPVQVAHEFGGPVVHLSDIPSNSIQCLALHSGFPTLKPVYASSRSDSFTLPSLTHVLPRIDESNSTSEFSTRAVCFIQASTSDEDDRPFKESGIFDGNATKRVRISNASPKSVAKTETTPPSLMLWLYEIVPSPSQPERATSSASAQKETVHLNEQNGPFENLLGGSSKTVKSRGPAVYSSWPDHHFFTRIYRATACFDAISRRKATFLANYEWISVPWENIPKNDMDKLLDIYVLLPGIFERSERLQGFPASIQRKLKARDLFENCMRIDKMFDDWYSELQSSSEQALYWAVQPRLQSENIASQDQGPMDDIRPLFTPEFGFIDPQIALLHLYYWAALCPLYQTIQEIHQILVESIPSIPMAVRSKPSTPQTPSYHSASSNSSSPASGNTYNPGPAVSNIPMVTEPYAQPSYQQQYQQQPQAYNETLPNFSSGPSQPLTSLQQAYPISASHIFTPNFQPTYHQFDDSFLFNTAPPRAPPPSQQTYVPLASTTPYPSFRPSISSTPALPEKYDSSATLHLANSICQSLPYTLHHTLRSFGPDHSVWPVWNAQQVYTRRGSECQVQEKWCVSLMEILHREGRNFATRMGKIVWKEYKGSDTSFGT